MARSRARRIPVALPPESRAAAWLRDVRVSGFALAMLLLIVAAVVVLAPGLKTLVEQRQQIAQLQQERDDARQQVDELEGEIDRWSDPAYIEAQARERLYYVYPGDTSFLVVGADDGPRTSDGLPISDQIQATRVDWLSALLGSVMTAGLTDAAPLDDGTIPSPTQGAGDEGTGEQGADDADAGTGG